MVRGGLMGGAAGQALPEADHQYYDMDPSTVRMLCLHAPLICIHICIPS